MTCQLTLKSKNELLSKLSNLFEETTEKSTVTEKSLFNFSANDTYKLIELINKIKNDTGKRLEESTKKFNETYDELQKVEVSLTSAPTDDEIGPLISELNKMNKEIGSLTDRN